jgi:hypothetical protein
MLLSALRELGSPASKRDTIAYIQQEHWFHILPEDWEPYPSQAQGSKEARWHSLIAWARKDSVIRDLISDHERDSWGLTRAGRDAIDRVRARFVSGELSAYGCFLWSPVFKAYIQPGYVSRPDEATRPFDLYRDLKIQRLRERYAGLI